MDTLKVISLRRSIRAFKDTPVAPELITRCLEAARLAPSSTNSQPWKFLVVRSRERREKLMEAAYGQKLIGQAPVVILLLGDTQAYRKRFRTGKELLDVGAIDSDTAAKVAAAYAGRKEEGNGEPAIRANCMIAGQNLILAATDLGLGSCWVMLFKKESIETLFNLPKHLFPIALIPLGFADQQPPPRPRYPLSELAFDEAVDRPWNTDSSPESI